MTTNRTEMVHAVQSSTLGDLLERILDKGVVISGDIRIKLVNVELLTIQIHLVICSVDRATEIGLDWWRTEGRIGAPSMTEATPILERLEQRMLQLEKRLETMGDPHD